MKLKNSGKKQNNAHRPSAARLRSGSLADFSARKDLSDFLVEAFARFSRRWFRRIL
jgi:hypothetical protein